MADVSCDPREHWLKPRFSKNEVAKSGGCFRIENVFVCLMEIFCMHVRDIMSMSLLEMATGAI